jgi:hypothetical protein
MSSLYLAILFMVSIVQMIQSLRQVTLVVRFAICMLSFAICNRHRIDMGLALEADCGNVVVDCYNKKEMLWGRQLLLYPK